MKTTSTPAKYLIRSLLLLCCLFSGLGSSAQYTARQLSVNGYNTALTRDAAANLYAVEYNATAGHYEVVRYPGTDPATRTVLYSGLASSYADFPWGIAVNAAGDVFVTNPDAADQWQILKLTAPAYTPTVLQKGKYYSTLALDANGQLLTTEYNSAAIPATYQLVRYPPATPNAAGNVLFTDLPFTPGQVTYPYAICADPQNNIYLLDAHENAGGRLIKLAASTNTPTYLASGRYFSSLTIDAAGSLYTVETTSATATQARVVKYTDPSQPGQTLYSALALQPLFLPWGIAVRDDTVFVSDGAAQAAIDGSPITGRLLRLTPPVYEVTGVTRTGASPTAAATVSFQVTFTNPVSNVTTSAFSLNTTGISGASVASVSGSGATYTVTVNTGAGSGTIRLDVNGTGISPAISNTPFTTGESYTINKTSPVVTAVQVPDDGYYKAGQPLLFSVQFDKTVMVTGAPVLPVIIGSTTKQAAYTGGTGSNVLKFSYTVATGDTDTDGIAIGPELLPAGATIKDALGNNAGLVINNAGSTSGVFVNTTRPAVTLSGQATGNQAWTLTVTFSEAVTGFSLTDLLTSNATPSNLYTADNTTYTVLLTPAADGAVTVSVPADAAVNIGNNGNTPSNTIHYVHDATAPVVTGVDVPASTYYKTGNVLRFSVSLSESVSVNTSGGVPSLQLTIGTSIVEAAFTQLDNNSQLVFEYTVQPGDMDLNGIVVNNISLNGGKIRDAAGNNANIMLQNTGNTSGVRVHTGIPRVVLSGPPAPATAWTMTVNFSEAVTGFTLQDITVTNASLSNLQTSDNIVYTVLVTPMSAGAVRLEVPANGAVNIAGTGNTASNVISYEYDAVPPAVTSVDVPGNGYYKAGSVLVFIIHFSEPVLVTGTPAIPVTIGSTPTQAAYTGGSGTNALTFRYTVQPGETDMDGITIGTAIAVNGGALKDAAGNNAVPALVNVGNTSGVFVNTATPRVTLSGSPALTTPWTLTATFSEAVTGFTTAGIDAANATISQLQTTDNIVYTALVTPAADGPVNLQVPAGAAVNIGGNGNSVSNPITYTYDGTPPAVTNVTVPAAGYYKAGTTLAFTVTFSEPVTVTGTPAIPVTIGSSTTPAVFTGGSGTNALSFRYTVQSGDTDMDGITIAQAIALNGATLKDAAGNDAALMLHNAGNTSGVFVNTTHPTAVLGTAAPARVNAPFVVTLTFSEVVSDLSIGDFSVTNATVSDLRTADRIRFTATVTPAADGNVSLQLPAGAAVNIGGNGNETSNILTRTYNAAPPVIAAGQSFTVNQFTANGAVIGTVSATASSGTLQNWVITTDGSGGAFALSQSGVLTVGNNTQLNVLAGTDVPLGITVSDGLNTSTVTTVTVRINAVNQPPLLDPVADRNACAAAAGSIQLTGASAVEPAQTYTITASAGHPWFDELQVNATGLLSYKLKPGIAGAVIITVTIKDNGGTAHGGADTFSRSFTMTVNSLPVADITSDKGSGISKGDVALLTATGGNSYVWDDAAGIIGARNNAVLQIRPQANTTYQVTVTNAAGCSHTASFSMNVVEDFKVAATNILTPNGDGRNDKWVIRNIDSYPDNELKIFDRTGRLIYTKRNYNNEWDGTLNGSPLAEGTYYYILTIRNGAKTAKGYITVIRDKH